LSYRSYLRTDITYYNESEPDPNTIKKSKAVGELIRDKIDLYYLGLALARREGLITVEQVRDILQETMSDLDFSHLKDVHFVGDASLLDFDNMFVEVRKSGTDAKLRGYSNGISREQCQKYLDRLANYSGDITPLYDKLIPAGFRDKLYSKQEQLYRAYLYKDL